jgi:hypothetical protein
VKIERLTPLEAMRWHDALPAQRRIATLSPAYVLADARRDASLEPVFFGYREGDAFWLHGVQRAAIPAIGGVDQQSPYGYGGPAANTSDAPFLERAWECYRAACREEGVLAEFVRLHPMAIDDWMYGGVVREDRQTVTIDLRVTDLRASFTGRCRTSLRKAQASGVTAAVASRELITGRFSDFYREAMQAIGATDFYLFGDEFFRGLQGWDKAELLVCQREGRWLSAGLFLTDGELMEYHLSATNDEGRKLGATNVLLDAAAQLARSRGCSHLYLGGGTSAAPDNALLKFKGSFSAQRRPFRIGFTAFQEDRYNELRTQYASAGKAVNRFLFYRD